MKIQHHRNRYDRKLLYVSLLGNKLRTQEQRDSLYRLHSPDLQYFGVQKYCREVNQEFGSVRHDCQSSRSNNILAFAVLMWLQKTQNLYLSATWPIQYFFGGGLLNHSIPTPWRPVTDL